jgi:hypothetical protein
MKPQGFFLTSFLETRAKKRQENGSNKTEFTAGTTTGRKAEKSSKR